MKTYYTVKCKSEETGNVCFNHSMNGFGCMTATHEINDATFYKDKKDADVMKENFIKEGRWINIETIKYETDNDVYVVNRG